MTDRTLNLTPELYDYLKKYSLREEGILEELRLQTNKMSMGHMQISPEQAQFMQFLIKLLQAKKTLDIGVFTGYSALAVALALPPEGKVIACDKNKEWTKIAVYFWEKAQVSHKIDLKIGAALETLQTLINEGQSNTFDFAFIDADKINYPDYYEKSFTLIRPGGVIAIDNVLWGGRVADQQVSDQNTTLIRELNAQILKDDRVFISMLPIGDGLTLALKK